MAARTVEQRIKALERKREQTRRYLRQAIAALEKANALNRRYQQEHPAGYLFGAVLDQQTRHAEYVLRDTLQGMATPPKEQD